MKTIHLSEEELQAYALDEQNCSKHITAHIDDCNVCKTKATAYRLVLDEIRHQPETTFNFDLAGLVMQQLPTSRKKRSYNFPIIVLILTIGTAIYLFKKQLADLIGGLSMLNWLIFSASIVLFTLLLLDMRFKFKKSMKIMDNALLQP